MADQKEYTLMDAEAEIRKQAARIKQLQDKFLTMQEMFLSLSDSKVCNVGDEFSAMSPVEIFRVDGSEVTVIACAGLITRFGMPPREFLKSFYDKGCTVIFVKDFAQCWYQKGLLSLSRNLKETAEVLTGLLPESTKTVRLTGTSAGGFAAIQLGVLMNADKITAFAPQTRILPQTYRTFAGADSRVEDINFSNLDVDIKHTLDKNPNFSGEINIHFGKDSVADVNAARYLKDYDCVKLHPHDYDKHGISGYLRETGALTGVLEDLIS